MLEKARVLLQQVGLHGKVNRCELLSFQLEAWFPGEVCCDVEMKEQMPSP